MSASPTPPLPGMRDVAPRSASELYALADGLKPLGRPAAKGCECTLCGRPIAAGEPVTPVKEVANPQTFTKWAYLAKPNSQVACGHCAATIGPEYQSDKVKAKSFACVEGVFPLHRGPDMARFLLNPPAPPFAAVFSTRQKQMQVFRTPLNWSREVIVLRYDDELLLIRMAQVRVAASAWREIEALVGAPFGNQKAIKPPVGVLSMTLQAAEIGRLQPAVVERLMLMGRSDLVAALDGLSTGEAWALASIVQLPEGESLAWRRFGEDR